MYDNGDLAGEWELAETKLGRNLGQELLYLLTYFDKIGFFKQQ